MIVKQFFDIFINEQINCSGNNLSEVPSEAITEMFGQLLRAAGYLSYSY